MNIEDYRHYCIQKKGVTESFPFDASTLVFKVMGKMFALTDVDQFERVNLKCSPKKSLELREQYNGIQPGYHMNKKHWNSVATASDVSDQLIYELIDESYKLVVDKLPKKQQAELKKI